jgi:DNA-binding PadR family transcriptional regulator
MKEISNNSEDNSILSDLVNDWILEPIVDSTNPQNIVFQLTTKGKEYFKILNKNNGYPFKNNPTLKIMVEKGIVTSIIKKEGAVGYDLTLIGEKHHVFLKSWIEKIKN